MQLFVASHQFIASKSTYSARFEQGLQSNLGYYNICRRAGRSATTSKHTPKGDQEHRGRAQKVTVPTSLSSRLLGLKDLAGFSPPPHIVGVSQGQHQSTGEELKKQHPNASLTPTSHFFADIAVFPLAAPDLDSCRRTCKKGTAVRQNKHRRAAEQP